MSEESDQEEGAYARGALVFKDNRTNIRGDTLACSVAGETSAIICIAKLGGGVMVAVPGGCLVNANCKAQAGEDFPSKSHGRRSGWLLCCRLGDPPCLRLPSRQGMGRSPLYARQGEDRVPCGLPNMRLGDGILHFAEALVRVADDQFAFTTAESGGGAAAS